MNKFSFKDLVQDEVKKPAKTEPLWTPIELPVREEKKAEYKSFSPRKGIKSLLDFNEDIKPVEDAVIEPLVVTLIEPIIEKSIVIEETTIEEIKVEQPSQEQIITLADRAVEQITKEVKLEEKADSFQQPESTVNVRSLNDVKKKIQYLQDWISKISLAGPGSGSYFLYDMGDTNYEIVKTPSNNDVLAYNSANAKWEVATVESLTSLFTASYFSNVNQTANVNTPRYVTFNNVDFQNGFTNDGANIIPSFSGIYNLEFSLQLHHSSGGGAGTNFELWLEKNGVDQPHTNTVVHVSSNNPYHVAAWNFLVDLNAGDKVALNWGVNNDKIILEAGGQTIGPSVPSAIITITSG